MMSILGRLRQVIYALYVEKSQLIIDEYLRRMFDAI
jgi:hypothetical protein